MQRARRRFGTQRLTVKFRASIRIDVVGRVRAIRRVCAIQCAQSRYGTRSRGILCSRQARVLIRVQGMRTKQGQISHRAPRRSIVTISSDIASNAFSRTQRTNRRLVTRSKGGGRQKSRVVGRMKFSRHRRNADRVSITRMGKFAAMAGHHRESDRCAYGRHRQRRANRTKSTFFGLKIVGKIVHDNKSNTFATVSFGQESKRRVKRQQNSCQRFKNQHTLDLPSTEPHRALRS